MRTIARTTDHPGAGPRRPAAPTGVTLVLGGGGLHGIAHVGVWRALMEHGLAPTRVVGTSAGALVGAAIASGQSWSEIVDAAGVLSARRLFDVDLRLLLHGARAASVFHAHPLRRLVRALVPVETFRALRVPLAINAVNLRTGRETWFSGGGAPAMGASAAGADEPVALHDAVYASCALPLCFPPARMRGDLYVDGALHAVLPLARAVHDAAAAADAPPAVIIAVELETGARLEESPGLAALYGRLFAMRRRGGAGGVPGPGPVTQRVAGIPVVHVRPAVAQLQALGRQGTAALLEAGRVATHRALALAADRWAQLRSGAGTPEDRHVPSGW